MIEIHSSFFNFEFELFDSRDAALFISSFAIIRNGCRISWKDEEELSNCLKSGLVVILNFNGFWGSERTQIFRE